jgi:hypothetical protein
MFVAFIKNRFPSAPDHFNRTLVAAGYCQPLCHSWLEFPLRFEFETELAWLGAPETGPPDERQARSRALFRERKNAMAKLDGTATS